MFEDRERVRLQRNCEVIMIPSGGKMVLRAGTEVMITQALGTNFTVITEDGCMVQVEGKDADAIGKKMEARAPAQVNPLSQEETEKLVWDQLKTCYDPEIPVNIVDLGLVYECKLTPFNDGKQADIKMTLTAPGCGMGSVLQGEIQQKLSLIPGIKQANVELVWEPTWNREMMSEAAKLKLGLM